ncbi:hypothetical protein FA13DRAFT_1058552 [Coprinellus micaceus]|uniref:Uncharacterized protein n=1 Tax=Coprinellus micaceus TaxID=71717 RepID=A0A4Y7RL89_COPMI|nr:hypothetical protein FA13DRAFT_1058552 [Coprinellus micaceus]
MSKPKAKPKAFIEHEASIDLKKAWPRSSCGARVTHTTPAPRWICTSRAAPFHLTSRPCLYTPLEGFRQAPCFLPPSWRNTTTILRIWAATRRDSHIRTLQGIGHRIQIQSTHIRILITATRLQARTRGCNPSRTRPRRWSTRSRTRHLP